MWVAPVIPFIGAKIKHALTIADDTFERFGFDPLLTVTCLTGRAVCCVMAVSFDKRNAEEAAQATECVNMLTDSLVQSGYIPYRCGIQMMKNLVTGSTGYWDVIRDLKQVMDPHGIIAPGRYCPSTVEAMKKEE